MKAHGLLEILRSHILNGTYFDNAAVIDQDTNLPKAIDDFSNSRLNLVSIEQVAFDHEDFAPARNKISLCAHQFVRIARNDCNIAAVGANMAREHQSESTRPTGDQDNFVV